MFIILFLFIIGLCVGSFINALEYRTEKGLSIAGRSFCPNCKHKLSWYDLIPVISWFTLHGKCRYCHKPISYQYPLIELLTGILFALVAYKINIIEYLSFSDAGDLIVKFIQIVFLLTVISILILIALHDAKTGYILSAFAYVGISLAFIFLLIGFFYQEQNIFQYFLPHILSATFFAGVFFLISSFSKEKYMGAGDAEIAFLIGFLLGWPATLVAFALAVIIGSTYSVIMIAKKKATLKSEVPFGPFLVAGAFLAYFFSDTLINFYVRIFLGA